MPSEKLGTWDAFFMGLGGMVGAAIFVFSGYTVHLAGWWALLSWLGAALIIVPIALLYTELAMLFPERGAVAVFPLRAFRGALGKYLSALEALSYVLGCLIGISVSAIVMGSMIPLRWVPVLLVAASTAVAASGIRLASRTNLALTLTVLVVMVAISGLEIMRGEVRIYGRLGEGVKAIPLAVLGYGAWTSVVSAAGAFRRPEKTVPRAVSLSILSTAAFYSLVVLGILMILGKEKAGLDAVARAAGAATGRIGSLVATAVAGISIFTTMIVLNLAASLSLEALAREGGAPRILSRGFRGAPTASSLLLGSLAAVLAAEPRLFEPLALAGAVAGTGLPYVLNLASHIKAFLGRRSPILGRAKLPVSVLSFFALAALELNLSADAALPSGASVAALLLLSLLITRRWRRGTCPS